MMMVWSHPAWVCGLKLSFFLIPSITRLSHPAWVCGLKQNAINDINELVKVTPCVGVWIETIQYDVLPGPLDGHTLRGCVD